MAELLLELLSEEIPARMQRKAAADLKKCVTDKLVAAGLSYEKADEYWTPRRLTLNIRGLSTRSKDIYEERKGPSTQAPQKAIDGFLRTVGFKDISEADIIHDSKKGDFYVAKIIQKGRQTEDILANIIPQIIHNFPWKKSMRWGDQTGTLKWIRPLKNILCIFGPENGEMQVVPFNANLLKNNNDSLKSNNLTYGHRFLSDGKPIQIQQFKDYTEKLKKYNVILDAEERKNIIVSEAQKLCIEKGLELVEDPALLEEVANLVEWPVVLISHFDESFLELPSKVIRLTIRTNQKCFVTREQGEKTKLSNHFILVSNIRANDGGEAIANGNRRVVQARLSDALYFWQKDKSTLYDFQMLKLTYRDLNKHFDKDNQRYLNDKQLQFLNELQLCSEKFSLDLNKPLDQRLALLDHLEVTFHAQLGTQGQRVERISALAEKIARDQERDPQLAKRAAILAKADLQTEMVGEFPELQGYIGRQYALSQGEDPHVAQAIEDHYQPLGPTDDIPDHHLSATVALADKIDTLVSFWCINEKPTGSKDPYALRRAVLGVIRIVLSGVLQEISLTPLFNEALSLLVKQNILEDNLGISIEPEFSEKAKTTLEDLLSFFHERFKDYLINEGIRYDVIEAILYEDSSNFLHIKYKAEKLNAFVQTANGHDCLSAIKRITNILDNKSLFITKNPGDFETNKINPKLFIAEEENQLYQAFEATSEKLYEFFDTANFDGQLESLVLLKEPINSFFNAVLVNDSDSDVRFNRLALLKKIDQKILGIAKFSKLVI
ncbi:glycine--tRNA ligase subunit beta [Bartonella sp. F02]|uniref:glycine--tRNA ligase subunit beta n=1 Tax=Bartonella sp. F02 TaxID=2967262 RepID=UPI0022A9C65C|nr:glycine--tRNA ligase subunit beta [Bartonella sp. F02]MCZ2328452.1 glycine--tRNA ligase subunit beta [Bartonella sp. F02]